MKNYYNTKLTLLVFTFLCSFLSWGQIAIPNTTPVVENFNSLGSTATAALPNGFRVNTTSNHTTGLAATTLAYGSSGAGVVTGTSGGGCINWANGITGSSTDRALGFLSTGTYTSPRSIILAIQNTGTTNISDLAISFDYEKIRSGSRAFNWTFFHGTTATNVNTSQTAGDQAYAADANNTTISNPPTVINKSFNLTGLSIAPSAIYYLCWTYTGVGGSTNSQGIGIDNLSLTATFAPIITDAVDYCNLQSPANGTITQGGAFNVYAQAYEPGVTEAGGIGTGIVGWIGYNTTNNDPSTAGWTWVPATFNVQSGNNDELTANIGTSLTAGTYYYASRFQLNGGPYRYGGYNGGFWNGTTNVNGVLTVNPSVVDFCNLQSPPTQTITEGSSFNVYAKVYEAGVTEPAGAPTGIQGWIGYSTTNVDPNTGSWTWVPATFNAQVVNDDEFVASIGSGLAAGTYYYASRFQLGSGAFRYGGYNGGFWNGTTNVNGVLTVNPLVVDYCNLQSPPTATIIEGGTVPIYAQAYEPGVTEAAGIGAGIQGWIGYNTTNNNPNTAGWTWVPATFNVQAGNNDELVANIGTGLAAGTYYYASRFQLGIGAFRYGGYNGGFWNGTTNVNGVLTVQGPEINIQGNAVSIVDNDASPSTADDTDFGSVTLGGNITKTFTIQNTGNANLNLTSASPYVTISGTNAADFSITTIPSNTIAGAASTTFVVTFNPSLTGVKNATLTINNNDLNESVYNFDIRGNCNPVIVNDLCSAATNLVINAAAISGTLTGSTFTAPFTKKDVWYSFTPTCSGSHTITVSGFTGDVDIELFAGACPTTTTALDGSAGTTTTETITLALTSGTTYFIRVLAFNVAAETANFNASVTSTSELQISNTGSPGIGNVTIGSNNVVIMGFMTTPNCATSYSISSVTLGAAAVATATIADVSNFRIFYDINANGIVDGVEASVSGAGIALGTTMVFTLSGQTGIVGPRRYLLVADISATAINGRTIKINLTPTTNLVATLIPAGTVTGTALGNTQTIVPPACTAAIISSVTPASGSVGTEVTITASSGNLTGALASFNGVSATVVSSSATQLIVRIPTGATTGNLVISDTQPCNAVVAYTVLTNDTSSCEGVISDLIIYEVYDEQRNSGGTIVLFNGTSTTKTLSNYRIFRAATYGGAYSNFATLTGTIAPGAIGTVKVAASDCGAAATNGSVSGGFNDLDGLQLRLSDGVTVVDDVAAPNFIGYYLKRNNGALTPNTTYTSANWTLVDVGEVPSGTNECLPFAIPPTGIGAPPVVTTHPTYTPSCGTISATLTTAGTEGFAGGNSLAYQWYFVAPGSAAWTAVTDGGIYSGATTASLAISNTTTVVNYQYYCQIRENLATCYSATNAIKIADTSTSTWNGTSWSNGVPSLTKPAIIDGAYTTATNGNFSCCSLTVNATRTLTISSGGYVEVQNNITNNGTFDVLSNGSLVQISDLAVNTGNIRYNRAANIRRQDYVYWSSPVAGFANSAISPGTNLGHQYKWLPTTGGTNNFGNWAFANETMVLGKGYIVRGPDSFSLSAVTNYTATFTGVPNNGVVTIPISRGDWNGGTYSTGVSTTLGTNEDDNWNLVGNPYPSAIHAVNFLTLNTNIAGFVNIWTHGTLPSNAIADPFYNNYVYNYTPGDYLTFNAVGPSTGPGAGSFNGRIAGGQGFFVSMLHTSASTTENLTFNNSLRNITYDSSQFYRTASATTNVDDLEKHRIWFDLVTPTGTSVRSLLGYVENATNGNDRLFDAFSNEKLSFNVFSLIEDEKMLIQGRTLPFDNNDKVKIGVTIPQDGLYKIALGAVDGLFLNSNQNIYLEDKLLNIIYDLRSAPYSFMGNKGTIKDRFLIRYNNGEVLDTENFDTNNEVVVVSNEELSVISTKEKITNIIVFDVLGRILFESKDVKSNNFILPVHKRNAPLFIEIGLENETKVNKKTVY